MPVLRRKWEPHDGGQSEILADDSRFRVAVCGRRFGKTKMARNAGFEYGFENPGSLVWFIAPSHEDARELFFEPLLAAIPPSLLADEPKRSPPREIRLTNGTRYSFRSFDSKNRGRGVDLGVIDEAGEYPNDKYYGELSPSFTDTKGKILAIGTPHSRNWFYEEYQRGQDPDITDTASWQFTSYDNPHVDNDEIDRQKERLPELVFAREYLAQFGEDEGAVFGNVRARNARPYELDLVQGAEPRVIGVDLGRLENYTVATCLDADGMVVDHMRERLKSWQAIERHLRQFFERNAPATAYLDAGRDNEVIERLVESVPNVIVERTTFTGGATGSKRDLIENLAAALETGEIIFPESLDALAVELESYEYEFTRSGNVQYGAPDGVKDDCVDSLALANQDGKYQKATW